jgi:hypothetical protein
MGAMLQFSARIRRHFAIVLVAGALAISPGSFVHGSAVPELPGNIGGGLRQLLDADGNNATTDTDRRTMRRALGASDRSAAIRVNIHLKNRGSAAEVKAQLKARNAIILAEQLSYKQGVICAEMKPVHLSGIANLPGVRSVLLAPKPFTRAGKVTSQAATVHRTNEVNALGFSGSGISIGVLSDSFNGSTDPVVSAADDIESGDLPGPGNPEGNTTPVVVLEDFYQPFGGASDEDAP